MVAALIRYIACAAGEVVGQTEGCVRLVWGDAEARCFDELGDALRELAAVSEHFSGSVDYGVSREEIWAAADTAGVAEILAYSPNGWVNVEGHWVPGDLIPDYAGRNDVYETNIGFGHLGVFVEVLAWEGVHVLCWQVPEGVESGWEMLGRVSEDTAAARARAVADELHAQWGLTFDEFVGLANLPADGRFVLPAGASYLGTIRTFLPDVGDTAACVAIYRDQSLGTSRFLVADGDVAVGMYASWDELEAAIEVEYGFELDLDDLNVDGNK